MVQPTFCLTLLFVSLLSAASPNIQAPGGGAVQVNAVAGDRVTVTSPYWEVSFDLRNGGVLDRIVFPHGSGKNLVVTPFRSYVNQWSDANAPATEVKSSCDGQIATLVFTGRMGAAGREPGPIAFETTWTLSGFVVRADHKLSVPADLQTSAIGIGSGAVRSDLSEYGLRVGPADDPDRNKQSPASFGKAGEADRILIAEHHAPLYMMLFDRGVEGLDFLTGSDLGTWESGPARRPGLGRYEARRAGDRIEIAREPLRVPDPVRVGKGDYVFSYYLGLPRIVEKSNRKWRHLSFGNHPFPSDAEVERWATDGVNIVRLHNDYSEDGNFWHGAAWPPYDEKGMTELRRVIAACRRNRIQVVPYFSIHEFHPEADGYKTHETEWKRANDQAGTVYHNAAGKGEFGAQMCPHSGWLDRRKRDIERAYRELGFDGIYYDWTGALACNNKAHGTGLHTGADGIVDLLAWTRRLIAPGGPLIVHIYGQMPSITIENFGDLIVNMEEITDDEQLMKIRDIPLPTVLAESIPRSPCPPYRADRSLERNRNNIAQLIVLGMFPWTSPLESEAQQATLNLFRTFRPYRLEDMRFRNALSGAVRTAWPDVYGALYSGSEQALAVVSNTSSAKRKNVVWTVKPELLGFHAGRVTIRDAAQTRTVDASALEDGSLATELGPYEYRVFEIRPTR
jgi:hypothetical protein